MAIKKQTKSRRLVTSAFHEVYSDTPDIVGETRKKKGDIAAEKQRTAIALDKARRAGADIPEKGGSNPGNDEDLRGLEHGMGAGNDRYKVINGRQRMLERMRDSGKISVEEFDRRRARLDEIKYEKPFDLTDAMDVERNEEPEQFAEDTPGTPSGPYPPVTLGKGG